MKILYIEAKSKTKPEAYNIDKSFIEKLPKEVFLSYTIQNKPQAEAMKKALEHYNIAVAGFQQVLGCTKLRVKEEHRTTDEMDDDDEIVPEVAYFIPAAARRRRKRKP